MIRIVTVFILLFFWSHVGALEDGAIPTVIKSKFLNVDYGHNVATYSGDVDVTQGSLRIKCGSMTIYYGSKSSKNSAYNLNVGSIEKINFDKKVSVFKDGKTAKGDSGTFDPKKNQIILTGNASLKDKENYLKSEAVVYDTVKKIFNTVIDSTVSKKRVRVILSDN